MMPDALWDYSLEPRATPYGGHRFYDDVRKRFVDSPEADQQIIRDYPFWIDKGPILDGTRVTLTTAKTHCAPDQAVRVAHFVEETAPGRMLYVVGPKKIRDEFINDMPVTEAAPRLDEYPWLPPSYDGEVVPSPGLDDNFEITEYRFNAPGIYRIQWCPGRYRSNVLKITVE